MKLRLGPWTKMPEVSELFCTGEAPCTAKPGPKGGQSV